MDVRNASNRGLPGHVEINIVSLVDVAFTLLIIFIITAPILQGGIEVELPQADSAPITSHEGMIVTVTRDGTIYIGDVAVDSPEDFMTIYPQLVEDSGVRDAYLKGDRDVPYGVVAQVLGMMKKLDVAEVGLVAVEPEN